MSASIVIGLLISSIAAGIIELGSGKNIEFGSSLIIILHIFLQPYDFLYSQLLLERYKEKAGKVYVYSRYARSTSKGDGHMENQGQDRRQLPQWPMNFKLGKAC